MRAAAGSNSSMRNVVIAGLVAIVAVLFAALYFLYQDKGRGNRMVIALTIRVALSISLVLFLVFSYWMGWISPTGMR